MNEDFSLPKYETHIEAILSAKTNDFFELAEIANLNPLQDLSGADLRNTNLKNADFRHADLRNANLQGACLENADLSGANLEGVDFRLAKLKGADLSNANLKAANFKDAELKDINLDGARFMEASNIVEALNTKPTNKKVRVFSYWGKLFNALGEKEKQSKFSII